MLPCFDPQGSPFATGKLDLDATPPMSPVPNRDPHDRTFSSTYMRSYYPNSRSGTPVFSSGLNNSLHAAPSRPTTSLGKVGALPCHPCP